MSVKITIDIFSGRPNPELVLTAREAKEFFKNVSPTGAMRKPSATTLARTCSSGPAWHTGRSVEIGNQRNAVFIFSFT